MTKVRFRLAEKDWPTYQRGDEWFTVDLLLSELDDMSWDDLDAFEREIGTSAYLLVESERRSATARYLRVAAWLARRFAGITEPYAEFKPNVRLMEWHVVEGGDADPPVGTPSDLSTESPSEPSFSTGIPPSPESST